jgi:hypothetical protein
MVAALAVAWSGQAREMSEEGRTVDSPTRVGELRGLWPCCFRFGG